MTLLRIIRDPSLVINRAKLEFITASKKKYDPQHASKGGYKRIYHVHIRKCAGTSLNKAIIAALGGSEETYLQLAKTPAKIKNVGGLPVVGWNKKLLDKEAFFYGFSHIPYYEFQHAPDTFRFTFLRSPIDRIVSHFRMLKDMQKEGNPHPALVAEAKWAKGKFSDFLDNIPRRHLENQLYMFSPTFDVDEAIKSLNLINYVGHVNTIASEFIPRLQDEFDLTVNYKPLRASECCFQLTKAEADALSQRVESEIKFYESACEIFNLLRGSADN